MRKIFFITSRNIIGPLGGPSGVNFRLFLVNERVQKIKNAIFLFGHYQLNSQSYKNYTNNHISQSNSKKNHMLKVIKKTFKFSKMLLPRNKFTIYIKSLIESIRITNMYIKIKRDFMFDDDDIIFFHDIDLIRMFRKIKATKILVYHQQGSLYDEWKSISKLESKQYKKYLDKRFTLILDDLKVLAFPSEGYKNDFLRQYDEFDFSKIKAITYLNNGIDFQNIPLEFPKDDFELSNTLIFITVAKLNYAKGVDLIPKYLHQINDKVLYKWIIIGNGTYEKELQDAFDTYPVNHLWIKKTLNKSEVRDYIMKSNFYISNHRLSVFDFSILESLEFGCVPVLNRTGGNNDILNNILSVEINLGDPSNLISFINKYDPSYHKSLIRDQAEEIFSDIAMINRYDKLIENIRVD
jgi:glycosyltransferase involved in cell wall biosynthesis